MRECPPGLEWDERKRRWTFEERGLDFADAEALFEGPHYIVPDIRKEYGEERFVVFGLFEGRLVVMAYTVRETCKRIISMRKANEREQAWFVERLGAH